MENQLPLFDEICEAPESEGEMETTLLDLFCGAAAAELDDSDEAFTEDIQEPLAALAGSTVRTFSESMLLTQNRGIIVALRNGVEFQLTIVRR